MKYVLRMVIFFAGIYSILTFISCQKKTTDPNPGNNPPDFSAVFESFWKQMNENYVYWDIDTTNWDNMYRYYQPVFKTLNLNSTADVKKSIHYFRQMTDGLIDSHYALNFLPAAVKDSFVFPASDRKLLNPNFHSPFLFSSIDSIYFDKGFVAGNYATATHQQIFAMSGTLQGKILYFTCNQFALQEAYQSSSANGVKTTLDYFFSQLKNLPPNIKGIIVDVRGNAGGNIADLNFFLGRFIDKPIQFGYTRYKSGNGRLDYTPWITSSILPYTGSKQLSLPIGVLADNYSISLAEAVTMAIRTMPKSVFIGETTWGATGPITDNATYNDGQFDVANFLSAFTSSAEFKYIDGKMYEGKGFPPDVAVSFNLTELRAGKDRQLETAISLIN